MPTYQYRAATSDGKILNGSLSGASRNQVVEQLHALGHVPIRIDESILQSKKRWLKFRGRKQRITDEDIADTTRALSTLLRAGLPLDRALAILISLAEEKPLASVLGNVRERLKEGATLAAAIEEQGRVFSRFYVNLVRAGETSGALDIVLERLTEHLERSKEIRDEVTSALIYPAILVCVALTSIIILLAYVVPQFTEMFEGVEQALPLSTQITIGIGQTLQNYGWLLLLGVAGMVWFVRRQLADARSRYRWDSWFLRLPMAGELIVKIEVARFARTLSILLQNGIALLEAVSIVKDIMGNRVLADGIEKVTSSLREGQNLATPLARMTQFPHLAVQMIRIGEESGNLQDILLQVATTYDRDTQMTIKRTLALLEPVLILVLGVIIAAVIISILVAILSINELVI